MISLLFISLPIFLNAQTIVDSIVFRPEVERSFVEAMKYYQSSNYDSASILFLKNSHEFPRSHRTTGTYIMGAKAFYEIKNYRESIRLLKDLIDLFPQSNYIDDAHYTLGLNYYRMGRYEDAASEFLTVRLISNERRLVERSEKMSDVVMSSYLSIAELQLLQSDTNNDEIKAHINLRLAEKIYRIGDVWTAQGILHGITSMSPNIKYVGDALLLLEQIQKQGVVKIGVALPLMLKVENPSVREMSLEFLHGIQIAIEEYNQTAPLKINLETRDTEKDPSIAARQIADLCTDEKVVAIVGPILSNEVFASAGIANERGVPLITPTATANGIAAVGPFIFQANPDFDTRGRAAAAFAYFKLNAKRFAVLAPSDEVGRQLAESFIAEVNKFNGEMIDVQWYIAGSSNLTTELSTMRQRALEKLEVPIIDFSAKMRQSELNKIVKWGVNQHVLDSLMERGLSAPVTLLFGDHGKEITDSLKITTRREPMKYDSLGLAVQNIDAIFVPIASSEEVPIISSQLKFFNIQAKILGTGDWNDLDILDQNRQYTDSIIFLTDIFYTSTNSSYRTFIAKYQAAHNNKVPSTNALYGYDVAKLLVQLISQGKTRRPEITAALAKVEGFEGLHSQISFSMNRVNSYLTVLQFKNRQIIRFGEIDLAKLKE
jgi:ABC-type branched-subunit amino acid transport system substrate-binding protein